VPCNAALAAVTAERYKYEYGVTPYLRTAHVPPQTPLPFKERWTDPAAPVMDQFNRLHSIMRLYHCSKPIPARFPVPSHLGLNAQLKSLSADSLKFNHSTP